MILGEIQFLDEITLLGTFFRDSKKISFFFSRKISATSTDREKKSRKREFCISLEEKKVSNCGPPYYYKRIYCTFTSGFKVLNFGYDIKIH
jgi:hypothetical protein